MKRKYTCLVVIFLIAVSCAAFVRIAGNDFIHFDDTEYITENNYVQSGISLQNIKWAFTAVILGNWHPLTMISHTLDWSIFGANASGHHLVNLFLHIGTVIFLFLFFNKTTNNLWSVAFAAALFALHPLRVESVAWASERKDVLSMFFGMAALYTYAFYAEGLKLSKYFLCLILFSLSLMSKPMLVTLPFALLLLDYWPLGRWQKAFAPVIVPIAASERAKKKTTKKHTADTIEVKKISIPLTSRFQMISSLLWEKVPFIFLTFISSIVTLWLQNKGGLVVSIENLTFSARVHNAVISYVSYLGKTFWPVDLAFFYPYEYPFPLGQTLFSCFILIVITVVVIYAIKRSPFLFVGWFWYLGTLIPVIGLVQVASQAMADRYTYLPSIGIAIILAWGIPSLFQREDMRKNILFPAGIAVLAILAVLTWQQCGYWKNDNTLFIHALQVTKNNYLAHNCLGNDLLKEGKNEEAINHYNEAIHLKPDYADAYYNRGKAYGDFGQHQQAITDYNEAIRLKPDFASAYYNRGIVYHNLGQHERAIEDYNEAIRLKQDFASAYKNRGIAYLLQGNK